MFDRGKSCLVFDEEVEVWDGSGKNVDIRVYVQPSDTTHEVAVQVERDGTIIFEEDLLLADYRAEGKFIVSVNGESVDIKIPSHCDLECAIRWRNKKLEEAGRNPVIATGPHPSWWEFMVGGRLVKVDTFEPSRSGYPGPEGFPIW